MDSTIDKVKILVIGDSGVGKSCLVNLICGNSKSNPSWTIGCSLEIKQHEFNEGTPNQKSYYLELWDVGGSKTHAIARHIFFHNYHAIILVHDLTNSKSKLNLKKWLAEVMYAGSNDGHSSNKSSSTNLFNLNDYDAEMFIDKNIPKLIVGTKLDMVDPNTLVKSKQYQLADELGADEIFLDCFSAKSFSPGSTNSVTLSRFFDKVIAKKIKPSASSVLGFFERNNRQQTNYATNTLNNYSTSNMNKPLSFRPVPSNMPNLTYNKKTFHLD